jgi:hypothetical protein
VTLRSCLFPAVPPLHLDAWHMDDAARRLTWQVTATRALVDCPVCRCPTRRIHSRDVRTVADLPWATLVTISWVCAILGEGR